MNFVPKNFVKKVGLQSTQVEVPVNVNLNGKEINVIVKFEIIVASNTRNFPPTIDSTYIDNIEVMKSYFE